MSTATVSEPIHVEDESQFEELIDEHEIVLVDYHAEWCGPCKMLEPTIKEVAADSDATVLKVDIDELRGLAETQGIRSVPTLEFYANGELKDSVVGVHDKDDLLSAIDSL